MNRTRVRAEDLFCARCRRANRLGAAHWPEGYLCAGCFTRVLEAYGTCTGCGVERLTPGLAPNGGRLCTDCVGGLGDFTCEQCGREARRYRRGGCGQCVLTECLRELLDDGTGSVCTELLPLLDALRQIRRPWGALTWTSKPRVQCNLQALARGQVPLTHDGLSQLTPWRSVTSCRRRRQGAPSHRRSAGEPGERGLWPELPRFSPGLIGGLSGLSSRSGKTLDREARPPVSLGKCSQK